MKKRIGQILVEAGVIDQFQLQSALGYQKQWGGRLGDVLIDRGFVKEPRLVQALSQQLGMAVAKLREIHVDPKAIEMVPRELCEKLRVFPVEVKGQGRTETLVLAMVDPTDLAALDQVAFTTRRRVTAVLAGKSELDGAIEQYYRGGMPAGIDLTTGRYQAGPEKPASADADDGDLLSSIETIAGSMNEPPPVDGAAAADAPPEEEMSMTIEPIIAGLQEDASHQAAQDAVAAMGIESNAVPTPRQPPPTADSLFEGVDMEPDAPRPDELAMELELPAETAAAGAAAWSEQMSVNAAEATQERAAVAMRAGGAAAPAAAQAPSPSNDEHDLPDARISTKDLTELVVGEPEAEASAEDVAAMEMTVPEPSSGAFATSSGSGASSPRGGAFAPRGGEQRPATERTEENPAAAAPPARPDDRLDALSAELDALTMDTEREMDSVHAPAAWEAAPDAAGEPAVEPPTEASGEAPAEPAPSGDSPGASPENGAASESWTEAAAGDVPQPAWSEAPPPEGEGEGVGGDGAAAEPSFLSYAEPGPGAAGEEGAAADAGETAEPPPEPGASGEDGGFVSYATESEPSTESEPPIESQPEPAAEPPPEPFAAEESPSAGSDAPSPPFDVPFEAPPEAAASAPESEPFEPPPEPAAQLSDGAAGEAAAQAPLASADAAAADPNGPIWALVRLLIRKGLFTEEEWIEELSRQ